MKRTLNTTVNRPTNATDSVSLVREWLYNRRSELAAATIGTNRYGYAYDTIGNRLWAADNLATNTYAANNLNQYSSILRDSASPREPTYDADGNLTFDGVFTYAYDAENRLVSVTSAVETNGSIRVLNAYDHRNRRIRKTVQRLSVTVAPPPSPPVETREWQTVATHTFVWDGNNIVLERIARADGTTHVCEYFWGMDKSGTEQGAGGVEGLLAVSVDGVFYIPCYDHNGNIVRYVSETGAIAAQYVYDPYGNILETYGDLADTFSFGFSTKYHDREIGMIGYQERVYSPVLGRWLNRDPVEEEGGENLYEFCNNNPILYYDVQGTVAQLLIPVTTTIVEAALESAAVVALAAAATMLADKFLRRRCPSAKCFPCDPAVGTVGYRIDISPPSKPHYPYTGTHTHLYVVNQSPPERECKCFWHPISVIDGSNPPVGAVLMNGTPGGGGVYFE